MQAWVQHASTLTPDGTPLTLWQHGLGWSIRARNEELMSSRMHGSEEEMARLAAPTQPGGSVLVGGLGMGFTLRAALTHLPQDGNVTVCELVPAVVEWNRGPLGPLAGNPLDDPRTKLHVGDVGALMNTTPGAWDAILLDVDNGPDAFTQKGNDRLYSPAGLARARKALRKGGALAVWSGYDAPAFVQQLSRAGFRAEAHNARAHGGKGARHVIYVGWV